MSRTQRPAFDFSPKQRLDYEQTALRLLFASLVGSYLEESGIQAQELAARMGKSKAWVSKLLSGRHNPTVDTMAEVALALGLRWDVSLSAADRRGTPAERDPEPPVWTKRKPEGLAPSQLRIVAFATGELRSTTTIPGSFMCPASPFSPSCGTQRFFASHTTITMAGAHNPIPKEGSMQITMVGQ